MPSRTGRHSRSSPKKRNGASPSAAGIPRTVRFDGGRACDGRGSRRSTCPAAAGEHVSEGDTVKLKSMGRAAVVTKKIDENHFDVEIGSMKMRIARDDIAEVVSRAGASPVEAARARGIKVSLDRDASASTTPTEINVIGRTVDEATSEVEKFVDRAFLAGMQRVRIVHGSGMGILRKALREYLKKHPHVETVAEAPQNEGGGGATLVELRV